MQESKNKNGSWTYRETYRDELTGKTKRVSVTLPNHSRVTRADAARILAGKIAALRDPGPKDATVQKLFDDYINFQRLHVKKSTWTRNRQSIQRFVDAIGPDALCRQLNAVNVAASMGTTNPTTYNQRLMRVRAMLRFGADNDYLDGRFIDRLKKLPEPSERQKVSEKYMEAEELAALISGMSVEQWRLLTQFLALTGLRIGEAAALEVKDVDSRRRLIRVNKTWNQTLKETGTNKTVDSDREIYIQNELLPVIADMQRFKMRFAAGDRLFYPAPGGGHLSIQAYEKYFRENTARIIGRRLTPHSLRHTHASLCFESGLQLETVSQRLGHADSEITRRIYLHITERKKTEFNKKLDSINFL